MRCLALSVLLSVSGYLEGGSPATHSDNLQALDRRLPDARDDVPDHYASPEIGALCDGTLRTCNGDHILLEGRKEYDEERNRGFFERLLYC